MFTHVITTGVFSRPSSVSRKTLEDSNQIMKSAIDNMPLDDGYEVKVMSTHGCASNNQMCHIDQLGERMQNHQDTNRRSFVDCMGTSGKIPSIIISDTIDLEDNQPVLSEAATGTKPAPSSTMKRSSRGAEPKGPSTRTRRNVSQTLNMQTSTELMLGDNCNKFHKGTNTRNVPIWRNTAMFAGRNKLENLDRIKSPFLSENEGHKKNSRNKFICGSQNNKSKPLNKVTSKLCAGKIWSMESPQMITPNKPLKKNESTFPNRYNQVDDESVVSQFVGNLQEMKTPCITCSTPINNINKKVMLPCRPSKIPLYIWNNTPSCRRHGGHPIETTIRRKNPPTIKNCFSLRESNYNLSSNNDRKCRSTVGRVVPKIHRKNSPPESLHLMSSYCTDATPAWKGMENTLAALQASNAVLRDSTLALEASVVLLKKSTAALKTRMEIEERKRSVPNISKKKGGERNNLSIIGDDSSSKLLVTKKQRVIQEKKSTTPRSCDPNCPQDDQSSDRTAVDTTFVNGRLSVILDPHDEFQINRRHSYSLCSPTTQNKEVNHDICPQPRRKSIHSTGFGETTSELFPTPYGMEDMSGAEQSSKFQFNQLQSAASETYDANSSYIPLPYLPQEEVNRFKNIHLAQVLIPQTFGLVLLWGCPNKLPGESFWEYLLRQKKSAVECLDRLRTEFHINEDDVERLKRNKDCSSLDVTLMFPLIQLCCDGLEDHLHPVWRQDYDTRTECLITKAKNKRNEICHGVRSAAVSGKIFEQTKTILMTLIKVSGEFFGQNKIKIETEQNLFANQVNALTLKTKERRLIELQHMFHTQGLAESKGYWKEYCTTDAVPFTDNIVQRDKVFHPMEVYIIDITKKCNMHKISYRDIFQRSEINGTRTSIIRGEAGSGKTTLLKNISLQFLQIIPNEIKFLNEIHLLLSMECRARQAKTLKQFIENNFPRTCRKVTADEALQCFSFIGNLIFIDGYDELNECSAQVVKEILHAMKTSMPFCHIVFTTRPHAAIALESFLKNQGVPYHSYELVKISEEEDQLQFLRRYEQTLTSNVNVVGMNEAFKELKEEVREFFVYPINLILFYYLFSHSREAIKQWENLNDVIGQISLLYEMFIERKLNEHSIPNLKYLIRELLAEVNCFALECLAKNKILLSDTQFQDIRARCATKLVAWGLLQVDANVVLSVVFLTKFSPTANSQPTYQFFHRSIQEMMAGRAVAKTLQDCKRESTNKILQKELGLLGDSRVAHPITKGNFSRFLNVLRFAVIELTEKDHGDRNLHHVREILAILEEEGANFEFWAGLVLSCPASPEVAEAGARAFPRTSWLISTPGDVVLASRLVRHLKLKLLRVSLPRGPVLTSALYTLMEGVGRKHDGLLFLELHSSYWNYICFDEAIVHLTNAHCGLSEFLGCLGSCKESVQALARAATLGKRVRLDISLSDPEQHHLKELEGTRTCLRVRVRLGAPGSVPTSRPLPRTWRGSPELTVECTLTTQPDEVLAHIVSLTPVDGRFAGVQLQHWPQTDDALKKLLHGLSAAGVKTNGFGITRWEPALANTNGDCSVCSNREHGLLERCVELWIL